LGDDLYISSTDNTDTQLISLLIYQVDGNGNWNWSTIETTLQGQTPVLVASNVARCHRMENEADAPNNILGIAYAYYDNTDVVAGEPQTQSNILSLIVNGANQSKQATFTIPTGYVGFLYRGEAGVLRTRDVAVDLAYVSRRVGKVFKQKKDFGLVTNGDNNYADRRVFPDPIPSKVDFELRVLSTTTNGIAAWGAFDVLLVEESLLSDAYLTAIGQIRRVE
jgi:hypothetical protein